MTHPPGESEAINIAGDQAVSKLKGKSVGLLGVLFLTVTGAAPMAAMMGNVPVAAGAGVGIHTPAAYLLAALVLTLFSVGYAAMAGTVSTVGGFYSFISQGLGRKLGVMAGFTSLVCYSLFESALTGLFAFFANQWLASHLGINVSWLWLALASVVGVSVLTYMDIKLGVVVLGVALVLESAILLVYCFGVITASSGTNFTAESVNIFHVTLPVVEQKVGEIAIGAGAAAVGIFMAFWSWVGFEMAPNYAEESRKAKHVVPLSLYISVISLGVFFTFVSWCAVAAFPNEGAMLASAVGDTGNFFLGPMEHFVGTWAKELMSVLIITSAFACGMAFHNTAARYMYSLGREGVIPKPFGKTHATYLSPHVASIAQSLFAAVCLVLYAASYGSDDPNTQAYLGIYTLFAVLGTGLLLVLQAIVSLAIFNYFRRNGGGAMFTTVVAPLVSCVLQVWLVILLISNLETFAGTSAFANKIPLIGLGIVVVGLVWGLLLKSVNPKAYHNIGHMVNDG